MNVLNYTRYARLDNFKQAPTTACDNELFYGQKTWVDPNGLAKNPKTTSII